MSATRTLAGYLSRLRYEDLSPSVVEKGKLAILDAVGNAIGGYPLSLSKTFLDLPKDLGGGTGQATLIGDGTNVSVPLAAFSNGALSTMLDYSDSVHSDSARCPACSSGRAGGIGCRRSAGNLGERAHLQRGGGIRGRSANSSLYGHD